jgi:opacity protein-like surface antigen
MKVQKWLIGALVVLVTGCFFMSSAIAADTPQNRDWEIGAGYQGMWMGGFLNGISARSWVKQRFGIEGNFFYGGIDADIDYLGSEDADLYVGEIKLMYAPIVRQYSKFYGGIVGSAGWVDLSGDLVDYKDEIYGLGAFIGSEFRFAEFPELGFNFDVGYRHYFYDDTIDGRDIDLDIKGINATFGIHYYF